MERQLKAPPRCVNGAVGGAENTLCEVKSSIGAGRAAVFEDETTDLASVSGRYRVLLGD